MRKARFTRHQFIAVLKSVEAERTVKDVCRETGKANAEWFYRTV
ncbi:transposase [Kosakonia radicincitans DSM 16656]|nr:IS3 family transposase [Kosakonia radicincitans]APG16681.1 transposase [Kosakonia radicincitans]ARD62347.1 transposase [Kosakonia radicincitans DSM 16656]QEM93028.1 IS3 family transposase [Kosakonia radicincitans]VVT47699.1 Transposase, IS3/IS911 family [Kosakonia radicincitans]